MGENEISLDDFGSCFGGEIILAPWKQLICQRKSWLNYLKKLMKIVSKLLVYSDDKICDYTLAKTTTTTTTEATTTTTTELTTTTTTEPTTTTTTMEPTTTTTTMEPTTTTTTMEPTTTTTTMEPTTTTTTMEPTTTTTTMEPTTTTAELTTTTTMEPTTTTTTELTTTKTTIQETTTIEPTTEASTKTSTNIATTPSTSSTIEESKPTSTSVLSESPTTTPTHIPTILDDSTTGIVTTSTTPNQMSSTTNSEISTKSYESTSSKKTSKMTSTTDQSPTSTIIQSDSSLMTTKSEIDSKTSTIDQQSTFDFYLQGLSWNETIEYKSTNFVLNATSVTGSIIKNQTYECKMENETDFVPAKQSSCFKFDSIAMQKLSFSSSVTFSSVSNSISSPGKYEIRITAVELDTNRQATHILTLYVIDSTTSTSTSASSSTTDLYSSVSSASSSASPSTSASFSTSHSSLASSLTSPSTSASSLELTETVSTTTSSDETTNINEYTTLSNYDFVLTGLSWNETIKFSDEQFMIDPIPNKDPEMRSISMECRSDSTKEFVLAKNSDCFNFETVSMQKMSFQSNVILAAVSTGFIGTGKYEIRINMTNLLTFEKASHILTVYVIDETTTNSEFTTTTTATTTTTNLLTKNEEGSTTINKISTTGFNKSNQSTSSIPTTKTTKPISHFSSESNKKSTTTKSIPDSDLEKSKTTTTELLGYDFVLNGLSWEETVYYSASTFYIEPIPNKNEKYRTISYECRNNSNHDFIPAKSAKNCFKFDSPVMRVLSFKSTIELKPVSSGFVGLGTYEIRINLTNLITLEKASHILTVHVIDNLTTINNEENGKRTTSKMIVQTLTTTSEELKITSDSDKFNTEIGLKTTTQLSNSEDEKTTKKELETTRRTTKTTETIPTSENEKTTETTTKNMRTLKTQTPISNEEENENIKRENRIKRELDQIGKKNSNRSVGAGADNSGNQNKSSNIMEAISKLSAGELEEVAKGILSGNVNISELGNVKTRIEALTSLSSALKESNSMLAEKMTSVIKELSEVNMTSARTMNSVLSSLDLALKGSTVFTLGVSNADGSYSVVYGSIHSTEYSVITPRSSLSIYGSTAFIIGDTRGVYTQRDSDSVTTTKSLSTMEANGRFALFDRSISVKESEVVDSIDMLKNKKSITSFGETIVKMSQYENSPIYSTAWNISFDENEIGSKNQLNSSFSFWLPAQKIELSLNIGPDTIFYLQATKTVESYGLKFSTTYQGNIFDINLGSGKVKFIEFGNETCILSYSIAEITITSSDNSKISDFKENLQFPITIENIDSKSLTNAKTSPISLEGFKNQSPRLVFTPIDINLPKVSSFSQQISISTFQPTTMTDQTTLEKMILDDLGIEIIGSIMFPNRSPIDVTGFKLLKTANGMIFIPNESLSSSILINSPKYSIVSLALGGYGIQLKSGTYTEESTPHYFSLLEFSETQKIRIDGGIIIRNCSNGYVIQNGKVTTEGDMTGAKIEILPQSLLTQESQEMIGTTLNNAENYLKTNGMSMSDAELNTTSTTLLSIASSLTSSMKIALNNPLSSDLEANLQYANENYDNLYNILPSDPDSIVYVEEMTSDQWASYVTEMLQKNIAKNLANQLESTLNSLENTIAARAIATGNLPFSYNNYIDGTGMIIEIREASSLVGKEWMCDDWVIILPTPVSSINSKMIQNDTIIQLGLVCYLTNPRFYSDNFDLLITSGAVEAHIKDINQNIIEISNTTKPITIKGRGSNQINEMTLIKSSEFENYQILDIHAFRTLNWNISIQLIIVESDENLDSNLTDLWMFSAHQRLPGPFQNNHQWKFELSTLNETRTYFIDSSDLINSSSLFYVGIGQRTDSTNESFEVDYGIFENKQWSFKKSLKFDYLFSAITKGCYSYSLEMDQFNSKGMSPNRLEGMSFVNCSSNHMTLYSVGSFNPITNADFNYIYVTENIVKNVRAMLSAVFLLILYAGLMLTEMLSKRKDISEGRIRFLSDNQPFDGYMYIITVETGYKMFATTDSTICFNLTGTEGDQIFRSFKSEEDHCYEYPFQWGQSSRFLMTTAFPLGNLEYMRIWIDDAGLDHRESWYCNRIIVKDLQTQQIFYFPFFNWLGTKNGDGETERLARVEPKRRFVDESMSLHILSETISWIAAFTGGGNRNRMRVSRYEYSTSIISIMTLLSIINAIICYYDDNSSTIATTIAITQISFGFKDIIIGILMALALTIFSMIHILICYNCRSSFEEQYLERYKLQNRTFKDPTKSWPYPVILISRSLFLTLILLGSLVTITIGMSLTSTAVDAFFFRFLLMFLLWIFIFEPIKGFIMAFIILKRYPNHKISSKLEEELLHVKPVETFTRNPYGRVEMNLGTEIADVTKLKVTEDRKMRDEQLFITVKDILCLFVSLFIMISLTYYCKDRHGYWYQKQISTTFQLSQSSYGDQAFMSITKADDFWNWARNSLAKTLRASWYDGNAAFGMRAFLNDKVSRSMGIGKIRQIRIKKSKECKVLEQFQNYIGNCEEELGEGNEETTEFMEKGWNKFENDSLMEPNEYYSYKKADELMTTKISGSLNSYGGGGYTVSLAGTVNELINTFSTLEDEQWIDQYTRAIIIEFSQYNAQINYFSVVQLLIEIPKSGIYLPNVWVESVRLIKSEGADGQTVQFFEIVYIIFSVIIFIKEISIYFYERNQVYKNMETIKNPIKFVANLLFRKFSPWNLMDLMVGGLALSSVVVYLLRQIYTKKAIDEFNKNNGNTYINLSLQRNTEFAFLYCLAGTVFLTSCKVIRILKFNRRIGILAATLDNALVSICGFGFVFVVFCLTFDSVLYVILGNKLFGYRSLISALQTSLAGMLGKLDITIISPVSQFGSIVAVIFIMLGSKLLLQLYVTIIMFEFENIRNDSERQTNEYEIIDHIKYKTKHRLGLLQPKDSHPVSIPDTQKDFRLFQIAQAKANFLHYRVNQILQGKYQFKYSNRWKFNMIFDPTDAIGKGKNSGKRTNKWRLNDLKLK